jgi:DnaJ-class molecular chaperone
MRCAMCKGYGRILVAGVLSLPCVNCGGEGRVARKKG